jgi:menaquinone-dependent protoporphyrinogen oxidase
MSGGNNWIYYLYKRMLENESSDRSTTEEKMEKQVLVAYASKYGATAEIAEKIGQVLRQSGLKADVQPADRGKDPALYDAIVLGSAVYIGQWQGKAAKFLQTNEKTLAQRPVWLFSSGPSGAGNPLGLVEGWRLPKSLQPVADRIRPRDIAVFHGNINVNKMNFIEKKMIENVKVPFGDFRDWDAIAAWASGIAGALKKAG